MKKLLLDVDALRVESFVAADAADSRGTVLGRATGPACPDFTMASDCALSDDDPTCRISCGGDCPFTYDTGCALSDDDPTCRISCGGGSPTCVKFCYEVPILVE